MTRLSTCLFFSFLALMLAACEFVTDSGGSLASDDSAVSATSGRPTISADVPMPSLLPWAPPAWDREIYVTKQGDAEADSIWLWLDDRYSYRIYLPDVPLTRDLQVLGGKDIVIIGGAFDMVPGTRDGNALMFIDNMNLSQNPVPRTIHVEGVQFDMSDTEGDAIVGRARMASYQFQNLRFTGIHGSEPTRHSDAFHNQVQVTDVDTVELAKNLRIFNATIYTQYQGITASHITGTLDMRRVGFHYIGNEVSKPLYLYLTWYADGCKTWTSTYLSEIYAEQWADPVGSREVYPSTSTIVPADCRATLNSSTLSWPPSLNVTGSVSLVTNTPEFVPAGAVGIGYVSPGYEF